MGRVAKGLYGKTIRGARKAKGKDEEEQARRHTQRVTAVVMKN